MTRHNTPRKVHPTQPNLSERVTEITKHRNAVTDISFQSVLSECSTLLLRTATYGSDDFIIFVVPPFIIGCPIYNRKNCTDRLVKYLLKMKMAVKHLSDYTLCICWNKAKNLDEMIDNVKEPQSRNVVNHSSNDREMKAIINNFEKNTRQDPKKEKGLQYMKRPPIDLFNSMRCKSRV